MKRILDYRQTLRAELVSLLESRANRQDTAIPWERDCFERLKAFAPAGKLLRGCLVCFAYRAYSGQPPNRPVIRTATALELTHSGFLIHDDIMDNDSLRRGEPSLYEQYRQLGVVQKASDPEQLGRNLAISVGDVALCLAYEQFAELDVEPRTAIRVRRLFARHLQHVCIGQMQDVYFDGHPAMPSKAAIFALMRAKTASYSFSLPLRLGATLAGQTDVISRRLEAFGTALGIIYQIRDDELGLMGDEAVLGKPVGSDIREGKKTLLYYYLLRRCSAAERRQLRQCFGNPELSGDGIAYVRRLFRRYRIHEQLSKDVDRLAKRADSLVAKLSLEAWAVAELRELIAFSAERHH